ncbi:MAG: glycosyltransferase family 2 protein, partial [Thioploca sp.]|nr:glycosyltransferase family 2 protein [Thioploca sp.]
MSYFLPPSYAEKTIYKEVMHRFVIVIPSYKNAKYYIKNLNSALSQNYSSFRIIYTDDSSPDGTGQFVEDYLKKNDKNGLVKLIRNECRVGALRNLYDMIHSC